MRKIGIQFFLLALAMLSFLISMIYNKALQEGKRQGKILCAGKTEATMNGENSRSLGEQEMESQHPLNYALFQEVRGETLENSSLNRQVEVTVLKIRGQLSVVLGDFVQMNQEDVNGCYLDEQAARELFGSTDVAGSSIVYGTRTLTVRGILKDLGGMAAIRPLEEETTDSILFDVEPGGSIRQQGEEFMNRHSLWGTLVDSSTVNQLGQLFPLFLPVTGAFILLWNIKSSIKKEAKDVSQKAIGYILMAATLALLMYTCGSVLEIPRDMIPTKWSDFSFWSRWLENQGEQLMLLVKSPKSMVEAKRILLLIKTAVPGVLAPVFLIRSF